MVKSVKLVASSDIILILKRSFANIGLLQLNTVQKNIQKTIVRFIFQKQILLDTIMLELRVLPVMLEFFLGGNECFPIGSFWSGTSVLE